MGLRYKIPKAALLVSSAALAGIGTIGADHVVQGNSPPVQQESEDFDQLFGDLKSMQEQMNSLFDRSFRQFPDMKRFDDVLIGTGDTDIRDEGSKYVVTVDLPGVDKSKIDLRVEGAALKISAVRSKLKEEKSENFVRKERQVGQIARAIALPGPVNKSDVKARYEDGVLTITAAKDTSAKSDSDKVEVQ